MSRPVHAIGFDYTGVVATLPVGNIFDTVAGITGSSREAVEAAYITRNRDFQIGNITQKQLWHRILDELGETSRLPAVWAAAHERLPEIDNSVLQFVDELRRAGYRTGLLSNLAPRTPWYDQLYASGVPSHFDAVCLSGETGLAKPDPAAFVDLAGKLAVHPDELIFIDDRPQAITGVESLGIRTIPFTDQANLRRHLEDLGCQWSH